ncbi:hypothetical protein NDU88_003366 [Pleurodeles waltl]|uniref:Uncharacterized protein n=1 Tax=Pleurodeles waltl TaxID=8319 RepID=A0AAV7W5V4_PLEWA|nr:hypothetical protein NDU88_003366 [Pleurodeles waltl]
MRRALCRPGAALARLTRSHWGLEEGTAQWRAGRLASEEGGSFGARPVAGSGPRLVLKSRGLARPCPDRAGAAGAWRRARLGSGPAAWLVRKVVALGPSSLLWAAPGCG